MTDEPCSKRLFEWPNSRWEDNVKFEIELSRDVLHDSFEFHRVPTNKYSLIVPVGLEEILRRLNFFMNLKYVTISGSALYQWFSTFWCSRHNSDINFVLRHSTIRIWK
jgi:hypothetical protein